MFNLLRMAWRNVGRNRRRSILSGLAVAFAVAILVFSMALQQGSYADMISATVHVRTGNLQIQHRDYWPKMNLSRRVVRPGELLAAADSLPGVEGCAPRIQAGALASTETRTFGAIILGIEPTRERTVSTLSALVREGAYLAPEDRDGALVGLTLARNLGAGLGDDIVVIGQGADGSLAAAKWKVRGLLKTGTTELDRSMIVAHIDAVGEAYSLYGAVSEIAILLERDSARPSVTVALEEKLHELKRDEAAILPWTTLMPGVEESIKLDWYSGQIIYLVLVLVVGFGIANAFLMAYLERIHEFGVLLSLGMKPRRVGLLVYAESVLLTLSGVVGGLVVGSLVVLYLHRTGIDFGEASQEIMAEYGMSSIIHPMLNTLVVSRSTLIVLSVALLLAVYPAVRASRLEPVEALRHR